MKPDALEHYVRGEAGYHNYTKALIARELKDIAALRLNSNGDSSAATVKVEGIRAYRLQLDRLKKAAERY